MFLLRLLLLLSKMSQLLTFYFYWPESRHGSSEIQPTYLSVHDIEGITKPNIQNFRNKFNNLASSIIGTTSIMKLMLPTCSIPNIFSVLFCISMNMLTRRLFCSNRRASLPSVFLFFCKTRTDFHYNYPLQRLASCHQYCFVITFNSLNCKIASHQF